MSKSKKTSYMQSESLLSEGFLDSIKNWIKKDQIKTLNKKLDKTNVKKDKTKAKLETAVDKLNKAMAPKSNLQTHRLSKCNDLKFKLSNSKKN